MMDRQHGGKIIFECEQCPATLETDTADWDDAKLHFDSEGWRARKVGGGVYEHDCPKCRR